MRKVRFAQAGYGADGRDLIKAFAAAVRGEGHSGFTVNDAIKSL